MAVGDVTFFEDGCIVMEVDKFDKEGEDMLPDLTEAELELEEDEWGPEDDVNDDPERFRDDDEEE